MRIRLVLAVVALAMPGVGGAQTPVPGVDVAELARQYMQAAQSPRPEMPAVLALVSFAMPAESLARLARDAARVGVPLVLRGLVDDSVRVTAQRVRAADPTQQAQWLVDPRPFREFRTVGVPVVAVRDGDGWQKVHGDVSLGHALALVARRGGSAGEVAAGLVRRLEEGE